MKKKIISALLSVVMIVSMLTAMCPGALAAQTVDVEVGIEYPATSLDAIKDENDNTFGLADSSGVVSTTSQTKNGITVTAAVSEDGKTLAISYSGTPQGAGMVDFEIKYYVGGAEQSYTVTFNVTQQKIEALLPEITSAEPVNLQLTYKQTDPAVAFKVDATGNGTISYRWRVDGTEVSSDSSLTIVPEDMTVGAHTVECVVSNTIDNTSKHDTVTWNLTIEEGDAPKITSEATSGKIDGTGTAKFVVTAEGDDLKYQWYMVSGGKKEPVADGVYGAITYSGATTNQLTVKCDMAPQDASTKFICEVTSANGLMTATEEYSLKITEDPNAEKVQKIEIVKKPTKTAYVVGETLDEEGLKIKVKTGKGEEEITKGFVCSPLYLDEEGTQTITVSYGGKTTTFTVTVEKAPHEHEWSDWQVDNGTPIKVYRVCIAGDDCTAKEVISKDSFIVQYPTIAAELGLTMDDGGNNSNGNTGNTGNNGNTGNTGNNDSNNNNSNTGNDSNVNNETGDVEEPETDVEESNKNKDKDDDKNEKKNSGNAILWVIIIIALILLAAVIFYYFKIYRKPYKKPNSNNKNTKR